MQIKFSSFDSLSGNHVHLEKMEEEDFEAFIREPQASDKRELPLLSFATYGKQKTSKGSYRHDKNVLALTGGKIDHDSGKLPFEDAVKAIKKLNVRAFIHTTSSHNRVCSSNPKGGPRFHVYFPFSRSVKGDQMHVVMHNWMRETAFLDPSDESAVMSQGFFYGSEDGAKPMQFYHHVSDQCIDEVLDLFREIPDDPEREEQLEPGEKDWTRNRAKAIVMLNKVSPDVGYWDWYRAMGAAKMMGATLDDVILWSSISPKFKSVEEVTQKYNDLDRAEAENVAGPGTLHYLAKDFPMVDPEEEEDEEVEESSLQDIPETIEVEPPEFIVGELIARGEAGQLVGPGGIGKSTLSMILGISVALGINFLGVERYWTKENKVLYISGEDGERGFLTRFDALMTSMRLTHKQKQKVRQNFKWLDMRKKANRKFRSLMRVSSENRNEYKEGALAKLLRKHAQGFGLVILDPLSSFSAGEENSNDSMKKFVEIIRDVADDLDAAILVVHHTGKGQKEYSQHSGRGGSAQADGSRMVLQVGVVHTDQVNIDGVNYAIPDSLRVLEEDFGRNRVLLFANMKQTWTERDSTPLFILRKGYKFTAGWGERAMNSATEKAKGSELEVLTFIRDNPGCTFKAITEAFKTTHGSTGPVQIIIGELTEKGWIVSPQADGRKRFSITDDGMEQL